MGNKNRQSKKESLTESDALVNNPFGALGGLELPSGECRVESAETSPHTGGRESSRAASTDVLRIRIEKKGRGGKTVTVIEGFSNDPAELATSLKQTLGTGGTCFEDIIELQGDCRTKAADHLRKQGYTVKGA